MILTTWRKHPDYIHITHIYTKEHTVLAVVKELFIQNKYLLKRVSHFGHSPYLTQ